MPAVQLIHETVLHILHVQQIEGLVSGGEEGTAGLVSRCLNCRVHC